MKSIILLPCYFGAAVFACTAMLTHAWLTLGIFWYQECNNSQEDVEACLYSLIKHYGEHINLHTSRQTSEFCHYQAFCSPL